jgi:hypothetical protein
VCPVTYPAHGQTHNLRCMPPAVYHSCGLLCRQCAEELARSWSQKVAAGGGETCVTADEGISRCTLDVIGASGFQVQFR